MDDAEKARAMRAAAIHRVRTEGAEVAARTLIEISGDRTAPKNARVAAARTLAEMTHLGGVDAIGLDKPLSEMTRAELAEARARAVAYLAELDAPTIETEAIDVSEELLALDAPEPITTGGFFD
ncbi:hypothetical protein LOK46_07880 [Methylobacterium sp. NMS14P]|uniref:hypothetical protein n=1 Tax=Methylobacterium sp. NMS14P TaxID=2894310 RepID=UPI0023596EC2|nr:hypothetical protein [Methylobacterium sp. NMS14P]WCS26732.1 hypothetical protein LOK46_07880 [Methylobacterium sp. NMS14P]